MKSNYKKLGNYIEPCDVLNVDGKITLLQGISNEKYFQECKSNKNDIDLCRYRVCEKGWFAYNRATTRNGEKISIAYREGETCLVSPSYKCFRIVDEHELHPQYLLLWLKRSEFDRYARFKSHGSAHEYFEFEEMCDVMLPVPSYEEQLEIVTRQKILRERISLLQQINDNLQDTCLTIYKDMFSKTKEEWPLGQLSDLLTVKYGKDHKLLADGRVPLYGSGGIMRYVEKPLYDKVSVLIPRKGTLSNIMYVDEPFWSVDTMFYTEIFKPYSAKFIYYFVKSKDIARLDTGSAVPSMSAEIIHSMQLAIPDDETLRKFDAYLSPIYAQIKVNNQECRELKELQNNILTTLSSR